MASRRPSQQPTVYIPAVRDEDDVPTNPMATTHERPTSRPAAPGWVVEPVLTYDREARTWRLAVPYDAEQRDKHGNTFLVHCQPDVVAAQLERSMQSAFVMPFTGDQTAEVDSRWRLVIVQAFRAGDRGELPRG
jgi:hypothetical protein